MVLSMELPERMFIQLPHLRDLMKLRCVFGVSVAHNLMKIEAADDDVSRSVFEMDGFISNSNYIAKKTTMVLFINGMHYLY